MAKLRKRGEQIRQFILDNVEHHPKDVSTLVSNAFGITRQAANKHIQQLVNQKSLLARGTTRNRRYILHPLDEWEKIFSLDGNLEEDLVWSDHIFPRLNHLPDNVRDIWMYGFTEMLNNAIDHSSGTHVNINLEKTATNTKIIIYDNGEGIFKKIQREMQLSDEKHAVLELSKGKLTTDPKNHTGEGIFFSSRAFDVYKIFSGSVVFSHTHAEVEDWIMDSQKSQAGTAVYMKLENNTSRTLKSVFDEFSTDENYGFTKTVVPVRLAQYGDEKLISRSQAKRVLARIDRFKVVIFDFDGIEIIGQAFADEIFRVFKNHHREIQILHMRATKEVEQMITRAQSRIES